MANKVEITIKLNDAQKVLEYLTSVDALVKQLNGKTINLNFNANSVKRVADDIGKVESQALRLRDILVNEAAEIQREWAAMGKVVSDVMKPMDALDHAAMDMQKSWDAIGKTATGSTLRIGDALVNEAAEIQREWAATGKAITEAMLPTDALDHAAMDMQKHWDAIGKTITSDPLFGDFLVDEPSFLDFTDKIADSIDRITSVATSGLNAISDFASGITDAFGGMSSILNTDFSKIAYATVAHQITRSIMGAIPNIVKRYDIMSTFSDYMNLAGVSTLDANNALARVNQSIMGIPIGLDEAAFRLRRYQMFLGDIDKATDLTIGVQNAIMAGGANEQMRNTAYTQIDRLLATGTLSQKRQWISLFNGLGVSLRFLKEELAIDPDASLQDVAGDLASGKIAVEDFLGAMERLSDNQGLTNALNIYKGTLEAWLANVKFAITRGGEQIMQALNSTMESTLGVGFTDILERVRDGINDVAKEIIGIIKNNPQFIEQFSSLFSGLFERLGSFDFGGFVQNIVERMSQLGDIIFTIMDNLPQGFLSDFLSFATTIAGPLAAIFKMVQGGLPVVLGVFERFKDFDFATLIEKIVNQVENLANVVAKLLSILPDGLMADLMAFGLVWGKPLANVISSIGGALSNFFKGMNGTGNGGEGLFSLLGMASTNPTIAMTMGIGGLATAIGLLIPTIVHFRGEYVEFMETIGSRHFDELHPEFNQLIEDTKNLREVAEEAKNTFGEGIFDADAQAAESRRVVESIKSVNDEIKNTTDSEARNRLIEEQLANIEKLKEVAQIDLSLDSETGLLDAESEAVLNLADSYIELAKAKAVAAAGQQYLQSLYSSIFDAKLQGKELQKERADILKDYNAQYNVVNAANATAENGVTQAISPDSPFYAQYQRELDQAADLEERRLGGLSDALRENDAAIAENNRAIGEYYGQIDDVSKMVAEAASVESELGSELETQEEKIQAIAKANEELATSYVELRDAARESLAEQYGGFEKLDELEYVSSSEAASNMEANTKRLEQLQTDYNTLIGGYGLFGNGDERIAGLRESYIDLVADIIGSGDAAMARTLATAVEDYSINDSTNFLQKILEEYQKQGIIEDYLSNLSAMFQTAAESENFGATIDELFTGFFTQPELFGDISADMVQQLASAFGAAVQSGDFNIVDDVISSLQLTDEQKAQLQVVAEQVEEAAETAKGNKDLAELLGVVGEQAELLNEIDLSGFKKALDDVSDSINRAADTAVRRRSSFSSLMFTISNLSSILSSAAGNATALARAINSIPTSKTVRVNYNNYRASGVVITDSWGQPVTAATGGYIYGPGVPSLAIGTDTVPAMLTPGEYVVRRDAVNMFGQTFLEAVNGMDVGAAYDAMMSRVSVPHGSTYNYYDNHAAVNMNFYGNTGQDFSQRKAFNFISKL